MHRPHTLTAACLSAVLAIGALVVGAVPVLAHQPGPDRIDLPDGWAPEGITAGPRNTVFVGSMVDGSVWKADVRTGKGSVLVHGPGVPATGVEYEAGAGRIWVAGATSGQVRVYDARSGRPLATYTFAPAGFLNDLVVTDHAVYVTDSMIQQLDVIPLGRRHALPAPSKVRTLPLTGDISFVPGEFNANGIVAARGWLIVVQSNTGKLFRVNPATGEARTIKLGASVDATFGDGLELHGGRLYVVQNQLNRVEVFRLGARLTSAKLQGFLSSSSLDVPTTAAFVRHNLYAVNARFSTPPTPQTPYWITRLPAKP